MPPYTLPGYRPLSPLDFNTARVRATEVGGALRQNAWPAIGVNVPDFVNKGESFQRNTQDMAEFPTDTSGYQDVTPYDMQPPAAPVAPAPTPYQGIRGDQHPANRVGGAIAKAPGDQHPPLAAAPSAPLSGGEGTNPPMAGQGGPLNIDPSQGGPLDITPGTSENAAPAEEGFFGDSVFSSVDERSAFLRHMSAGLLSGRTWGEGLGKGMAAHAGYKDRQEHREDQQEFRTEERKASQDFQTARDEKAHERAVERDETRYERDKAIAGIRAASRAALTAGKSNSIAGQLQDEEGNVFHSGVFQNGQYTYIGPDGNRMPLTEITAQYGALHGATKSSTSVLRMSATAAEKLRTGIQEQESKLIGFKKTYDHLQKADKGLVKTASWLSRVYKTATDQGLSEQEIVNALAEGNMQGMIGKVRLDALGPGPVTEFDAKRLAEVVGMSAGGFDWKSPPEVMARKLDSLFGQAEKDYLEDVSRYNTWVDRSGSPTSMRWKAKDYSKRESLPSTSRLSGKPKGALSEGPKIGDTRTLSSGRVVTWNGTEFK